MDSGIATPHLIHRHPGRFTISTRRKLLSQSCLFQSLRTSTIAKIFNWDEHWIYFFFSPNKPELRLPPEELLYESACYSHGERVLIQIALDLWCEKGNAKLTDLIEILDDDTFLRVIAALLDIRELTLDDLCSCSDLPDED